MTETNSTYLILEERGLILINGEDRRSFLQGLISNDTAKITEETAIYAAFLTPQGKYLHDFFIIEHEGALLLDCEANRLADLLKRLKMYTLRAKVTLTDVSEQYLVAAIFGDTRIDSHLIACRYVDPRSSNMGLRAIIARTDNLNGLSSLGAKPMTRQYYDSHRLKLGIPDGSRDLVVDKSILMESGFDELGGIDWNKGCYIGQELTARTKHRGLVKKRLMPVTFDGPPPPAGSSIKAGEKEAGEMRSGIDGMGLALLRLEYLQEGSPELVCEQTRITPAPLGEG